MGIYEKNMARTFSILGEKFSGFGNGPGDKGIIEKACGENPWFTPGEIMFAMDAIYKEMLQQDKLEQWLANYSPAAGPKKVGVIMAGNIPLAGFFDMMCVLVSGHSCYVKPSSKDRVLTDYVFTALKNIAPEIPLHYYSGQHIGAVIASGSDNTNRYFKKMFGGMPSVLRGTRFSAGILTGEETDMQLNSLARDIFMYSGLGCRSVCKLFLPEGYDTERLADSLAGYKDINPKYLNNLRQRLAVLRMNGNEVIQGPHFVLREDSGFPIAISEITFSRYSGIPEVLQWLEDNDGKIQCVVCDTEKLTDLPRRAVRFGRSQYPGLADYPDDVDIMAFLSGL